MDNILHGSFWRAFRLGTRVYDLVFTAILHLSKPVFRVAFLHQAEEFGEILLKEFRPSLKLTAIILIVGSLTIGILIALAFFHTGSPTIPQSHPNIPVTK